MDDMDLSFAKHRLSVARMERSEIREQRCHMKRDGRDKPGHDRKRRYSPHGAKRNAVAAVQFPSQFPDFAALHPGYGSVYSSR